MKHFKSTILTLMIGSFLASSVFAAGKIQNEDVKTLTELQAAGGSVSQLINDSKIYVSALGINDQLSNAIAGGQLGGGGGSGVNVLQSVNPGFEGGLTGWTATGGTTSVDSSTPLFGKKSAVWDASALNQTFSSTAKAIPSGLMGASCLAMISYQFAGASGDYHLQVFDGSVVLADQSLDPTTGTAVGTGYVGFQCPTTGTILLRLIAGVSNPAAIKIDGPALGGGSVQLGSNLLVAQISHAELFGSTNIPANAGCTWASTSGSYGSFSAVPACNLAVVTGRAAAPATKIPAIRFNNLPPGEYIFIATGSFNMSAAPGNYSKYRFFDGTTQLIGESKVDSTSASGSIGVPTINGYLSNPSARSSVTVEIQCLTSNPGQNCDVDNSAADLSIVAIKLPSGAQSIVSGVETAAQSWSGYTSCPGSPTTTSSTFTDVSAGTGCAVNQLQSDGFGTVSLGATDASINFIPSSVGKYLVCATAQVTTNAGDVSLALTDGSNNILSAMGGLSAKTAPTLCSLYNSTSVGPTMTAKLRLAVASGAASLNSVVAGAAGSHTIDWTIVKVSQQFPMPYLAKQIQSPSGAVMIHASARLNCLTGPPPLGTCTIVAAQNDGNWISSIVKNSQGNYTMNIAANTFSQEPNCVCSVIDNSQEKNCQIYSPGSTSVSVQIDFSGTSSDRDFTLMCTGKK